PMENELRRFLAERGACDAGFALLPDSGSQDCRYAVSVVFRLSDAVIDEIGDGPTPTYYQHYRAVNALIDRTLLEAGLFLQREGYRYIPVAASQSINDAEQHYAGRYSHRKAACLAGLGTIGKNSCFIHRQYGCRVRLGTLLTDCPFEWLKGPATFDPCGGCVKCVEACPAKAISGKSWAPGMPREGFFDPAACSAYMKTASRDTGRGAVCGLCLAVCPYNKIQPV
nr:4Fe-4S double cluster binding domain-containing protein [Clostridiales bacterium]